jgi:uncharacterized protein (DUF302 family)
MPTRHVTIRRVSVISSRPFDEVVSTLEATIGRPDMKAFRAALSAAATVDDLATVVHAAIGSSELMEFVRFDQGQVLRKGRSGDGPRILRLVVGNPLIMKKMVSAVPDAASYAPVTILITERADGVHLTYDTMASLIEPYGNSSALAVATDLDTKIEGLLETVAR